ncbi:50S ribosomal protein L3 [Candidatus Woesearchaeota archaeon]|nr:50S ribosomal protein L3 [Candidatus Woesearchaeota archaeon]
MGHKHHPRRGSLQYWPHVRSSKHAPRIRSWTASKDKKLLGFLGYKVGMTHVLLKEINPNSPRKNMDVFTPVTVIECPPLKTYSVRYYTQNENGDLALTSEVFSKKTDKELTRKLKISKKDNKAPEQFDLVKVLLYSQPKLTGVRKKKPDMLEFGLGGKNLQEKSEFALSLLDKEIKISDVFKDGQFLDVHSVTKGKGFSGTNKKFGVKSLQHKSEKGTRGIGTLGPWHPNRVAYTVAQAGKWGYHLRTEYNKVAVKIGHNPKEINPKGGFINYGFVKSDFILVKGSLPGATKRPVGLSEAIRPKLKSQLKTVAYISVESKQR